MLETGNSAGRMLQQLACESLANGELEEPIFVLTGAQRGPSRPTLNGRLLVGCLRTACRLSSFCQIGRLRILDMDVWSLSMAFDSDGCQSRAQTDCLHERAQGRKGRTGPNPGEWAVERTIRACRNVDM